MSKVTLLDYRRSRRKRDPKADSAPPEEGYWRRKTLAEMNEREWESLCDQCGKCCVISIEDVDTGRLHLTDVSCKLFDTAACGCSDYANRKQYVPDCVKLTPKNVPKLDWLPQTCAYRLVSEGKDLFWWHPLVSGDSESVHIAQASVRNQTRPEGRLKMAGLLRRITLWPAPLEEPPSRARKRKK
ncbi:MAG: YcgN family cysteine cluster protein [Hyphomonadaceae bacterium]|nr:YcgN family cysteine cluster protein [Hyphomonadaceae bacterium]